MNNRETNWARKCWADLGSIQLFNYLALLISFWFFLSLIVYPHYFKIFNGMEETVLLKWLLETGSAVHPIRGWLLVLLLLVTLLTINLAICVVNDFGVIVRMIRAGRTGNGNLIGRASIFIIHLSYIILILGHLVSATVGFKLSYELDEGMLISDSRIPFTVRCEQIEMVKDDHGRPAPIVTALINPGGPGEKTLKLRKGNTVFQAGRLLVLATRKIEPGKENSHEYNRGKKAEKPEIVPVLRVMKNPGLPVDFVGGILFFVGMALQMIFRPWRN